MGGLRWNLNPANRHSTEKHNIYKFLYIYSIRPDDGLQICPKHVEVDWRNKLRINSAWSWFSLHRCIEMHGQQNIKPRPICKIQIMQEHRSCKLAQQFMNRAGNVVRRTVLSFSHQVVWENYVFLLSEMFTVTICTKKFLFFCKNNYILWNDDAIKCKYT